MGIAPFIAERALAGSEQSPASCHEFSKARNLRIIQSRDVRQYQRGELLALAFNMIRMDGQVRNARSDQGLCQAAPWLVHEQVGLIASIEVRILLRPNHADGGDRFSVDQIF